MLKTKFNGNLFWTFSHGISGAFHLYASQILHKYQGINKWLLRKTASINLADELLEIGDLESPNNITFLKIFLNLHTSKH